MARPRKLQAFWLIGLVLVLLSTVAASASAGRQLWTPVGPYGGDINAIAIDPKTPAILYATTDAGGVFKSTDGGRAMGRDKRRTERDRHHVSERGR